MGYDNRFSLKLKGEVTKPAKYCPACVEEKDGNFCNICATPLSIREVPVDKKDIINELRTFSDDCAYLLDEKEGHSNETGSGHEIENDIKKFSVNYPNIIFQLDCDWDSGFGNPPSRYYFKNGVKKDAKAKVIYKDPDFD